MQYINLQAIPNQSLTVRLDNSLYVLRFTATDSVMSVDITRDGVVLLTGARVVGGTPLIPYKYLTTGNFLILTENEEIPYYTQFGVTQNLIYASPSEVQAIYAGT